MTLRRCQFGEHLPPNVSCAALCLTFPDCMPPSSPELLSTIRGFWADGRARSENHEAVASTLEQLHEAVTEGLKRREQP